MKKFFGFNKLLASVAVLASVMIFQSCLDDDDIPETHNSL